jgi:ABC-type bacteriocin/lantibiotic exporter with double-glycine peptidase domain
MNESIIYKGAILSAVSLAVGGIIIAAMIMGYSYEYFNIILAIISVLIVIGIVIIMYGTSKIKEEQEESGE